MKQPCNWITRLMAINLLIAAAAFAQPAAVQPAADISEEALIAFAEEIENSMASGDDSFLSEHMDFDAMAEEVTGGIATPAEVRKGFIKGFTSDKRAFSREILSSVQSNGSYSFLRLETEEGEKVLLFRLIGPTGLNYHKLYVHRRADGELTIRDMYIAVTSERVTQTVRRLYIPMAIQAGGPPSPESKELLEMTNLLAQMGDERREGKFAEALKTYEKIPKKHQMNKTVQLVRLACAMNVDNEEYAKVMAECAPLFKDDISADMLAIDANLLQGKFAESHAAVDRVNQKIGGDPYLDVMHAGIYYSEGNNDKAREACERALEADPYLFQAYDNLLSLALAEQDHAETARLLELFTSQYGLQFGDLTDVDGYGEFVKSPEYKTWMANKATP